MTLQQPRRNRNQADPRSVGGAVELRAVALPLSRSECELGLEKGQQQDGVMVEHLNRFGAAEGVVFVGRPQEKTRVVRTEKRRNPTTGQSYPWLVRSTAMVNHFYVYAMDRDFGPFFLKFGTYFPYDAKLCLNGHESAKRQLTQRGIPYEAHDNAILSCENPRRVHTICDGLSAAKIEAFAHKWPRRLPHRFSAQDQRAGDWSP